MMDRVRHILERLLGYVSTDIAIDLGIIDIDEVVEVLKNKPKAMEIVLTGRNAHEKAITGAG